MAQKRLTAINDISCLGKCSITVSLPIISCVGIETSVIPTVLLSTHTGGFKNNASLLLDDMIISIASHWKSEGVSTDAVYTGYICNKNQIESVIKAVGMISKPETVIITDPVMADHGRLYSGFSSDFPEYMLKLCRLADIITPNITEAALLAGIPYEQAGTEEYIEKLLKILYEKTGAVTVITGVSFDENRMGAAVFDGNKTEYVFSAKRPYVYHGTGDIFSSVLSAGVVLGKSVKDAAQIAADFVCKCIEITVENGTEERFGVDFEHAIPVLLKFFNR